MAHTWSHSTRERNDTWWAACASLFFHALLILTLASSPSLNFTIGRETRFDILWVSPSSLPSASPAESPQPNGPDEAAAAPSRETAEPADAQAPPPSPAEAGARRAAPDTGKSELPVVLLAAAPAAPKKPVSPAAAPRATRTTAGQQVSQANNLPAPAPLAKAPPSAVAPEDGEEPATPEPATTPPASKEEKAELTMEAANEQTRGKPVSAPLTSEPPPPPPPPARRLDPPAAAVIQPVVAKAAEPARVKPAAPSVNPSVPVAPAPSSQIAEAAKPPEPRPLPAPPRMAAGKTSPEASALPPRPELQAGPARAAAPAAKTAGAASPKAVPATASAAAKDAAAQRVQEKPPQQRGITVSSLRGDLKLLIACDSGVRLTVTFTPYPKASRNKVLSRAEAHREQRIQPLIGTTRQETREAVIQTAQEGIYVFSVESEKGEPAKATFTLKIFEAGTREKVARLGTRTVTGKSILTKIMMPEGILWEDDAAFTGSLEDANSTTKFNTKLGLYWKEYND